MERRHTTECSFYTKVGACKHGKNCDKLHTTPVSSQSIMIPHLYPTAELYSQIDYSDLPELTVDRIGPPTNSYELAEYKDIFYEDILDQLLEYGEITDYVVSENVCSHLQGSVLVRYKNIEDAKKAYENLSERFYDGRVIVPEYCPVVNVRYARCKAHDDFVRGYSDKDCKFGGECNYIHAMMPSNDIVREIRGLIRP